MERMAELPRHAWKAVDPRPDGSEKHATMTLRFTLSIFGTLTIHWHIGESREPVSSRIGTGTAAFGRTVPPYRALSGSDTCKVAEGTDAMASQMTQHWAGLGALLAGMGFAASATIAFIAPDSGHILGDIYPVYNYIRLLQVVAVLALLVVLIDIRNLHSQRLHWWGHLGFTVTTIGTVLILVGNGLWLASGGWDTYVGISWLAGHVCWLIGFPLSGVVVVRAKLLPSWFGWLIVAFAPVVVVMLVQFESYVLMGLWSATVWLALGVGLLASRTRSGRSAVAPE
jgi:hypothetical protein